jgi:lysine-N-methylase
MLKPLPRLEPSYYEAFRCVGAVCEDTCCRGWRVPVDKETFQKYQACADPVLGAKLHGLVNINVSGLSDESYAEIALNDSACPFLAEGLCEIQARLGEEYLSKNCATYPRVMCLVDGVLERSLDLSCPEAARLALSNPQAMQFVERAGAGDETRLGTLGIVDTTNCKDPGKPYRYVREVRSLMIALLQNRGYPISQRLLALGRLCDKLEADGNEEGCETLRELSKDCGAMSGVIPARASMPATERFELVIELILSGIAADATGRRFLDCYQRFMAGLHWTMDSSMEELAERLDVACKGPYADFRAQHEYVLEHYLVAYVFRSLFPFGAESVNRKLAEYRFEHSMAHQYQLMVVDFVVIDTLLAGLGAFYGPRFGMMEALKLIQSATKTFEHSLSYPGKVLALLAAHGLADCASMSMLIRD